MRPRGSDIKVNPRTEKVLLMRLRGSDIKVNPRIKKLLLARPQKEHKIGRQDAYPTHLRTQIWSLV